MSEPDALERALRRILWLLRPYLPDLVVIGGWVPHLYRNYGGFASWKSQLSRTAEVDVLVGENTSTTDRPPMAELLRGAGFESAAQGAVWANDPSTGEKIEFFVPHVGIARDIGRPRPLRGQQGVGAIPLTDLTLLGTHTRELTVPVTITNGHTEPLKVRVPSLGAYAVVKASTFMKRPAPASGEGRSRRAKDLVYIRDVMAAGSEVAERVEADIQGIRQLGAPALAQLDYARSQLRLLDDRSPVLREAGEELGERDGVQLEDAVLDLRGHLADLEDILAMSGAAD